MVFVSLAKPVYTDTDLIKMKMFPYLLLFWQKLNAQMESSTGFTGKLTGRFGFQ